ncbi:MAG: prepilin-type N-terminal cleavage/methylation domain-containing protein [Gemmatimonadales bacterium]
MKRRGFTIIEVMIAIVILGIVAASLGRFVGGFLHAVGTSTTRTVATSVAQEQIERIELDPSYTGLVATYNNVTTTGFPDYPNMTRTTRVTRTTGNNPRRDYTTVTVQVTEPTLNRPINLTVVVAAP